MFAVSSPAIRRRDGVVRFARPGAEWLSTGWNGGRRRADCAYNVSVPEGWARTDLGAYADERLERAGFEDPGPVLFTGVDADHARGARCGPVTACATAGVSNPAVLPMVPAGGTLPGAEPSSDSPAGTVNVLVYADRRLADGALANLVAVAAEAKAATLLAETGFPGTTTDAVVAGHDPDGEPAAFSGSATPIGAATRACVREAVRASLRARYGDGDDRPESLADAPYGVSTDARAQVFEPALEDPDGGRER
ncbi:adenosylcobinamide amidohydrolase [Natronococcus sp. JC468]|uniref:adenosylcobinamide amidohydrolase n=1 Tax=Natronococcus sp. JC468 TaxID=1961921 RepID=UPI001439E959|nr:adenosylcobinamide amidohydrolase [Natronococcus sp. JC468]NKE36357.1 adenosylcobinamide amidohydrolase [Natronococcus sp. JC468]